MADLELQVRDYAAGLDLGPAIDPAEITGPGPTVRPPAPRSGRRLFLVAAAVLVVVVLGAAIVALRARGIEEPAPPAGPPGVPTGWERIGEIDDAQPFAMAASDRGVVLAGYGFWWSADGATWEDTRVDGKSGFDATRPDLVSDVIATDGGFLAVGTGFDKQPGVWRSADGRAWTRVVDDDLQLPTGSIPTDASTPYGTIEAIVATDDGFVAVGSVFIGTFAGETLVSPEPFAPAVWTSGDGSDWVRAPGLPTGSGTLVDVVGPGANTGDVVAVGADAGRSYSWEMRFGTWVQIGVMDGTVTSVARVDGRLVAAGWHSSADRDQVGTIWSSRDGRGTWEVAHEEAPSALGTLTDLVSDGGLLVALGYSGPGELDTRPVLLGSTDGTTWTALPPPSDDNSYPADAAVHDGELLLVLQESDSIDPEPGELPAFGLRAAIYRADRSRVSPVEPAPLRARFELTGTRLATGATIDATVVVQNDTGQPIVATRCGTLYAAELHGEAYSQQFGEALCGGTPFEIPIGESRWPVKLLGSRSSCSGSDPVPEGQVPCLEGSRLPPLPPGVYVLVATAPGNAPLPDPVTIEVE